MNFISCSALPISPVHVPSILSLPIQLKTWSSLFVSAVNLLWYHASRTSVNASTPGRASFYCLDWIIVHAWVARYTGLFLGPFSVSRYMRCQELFPRRSCRFLGPRINWNGVIWVPRPKLVARRFLFINKAVQECINCFCLIFPIWRGKA